MKHTKVNEFSNRELAELRTKKDEFGDHIIRGSLSQMMHELELSEIQKISNISIIEESLVVIKAKIEYWETLKTPLALNKLDYYSNIYEELRSRDITRFKIVILTNN